jgi:hypothetical protein
MRRLSRTTLRLRITQTTRTLNRSSTRNLPAYNWGPDYLRQALRAYQRALNAHKKLTRLAPQYFDSTEVSRLAYRRVKEEEWCATWEPAFARVYGPSAASASASTPAPSDYLPQPPRCPRTRRVVEREFLNWQLFLNCGDVALHEYRARKSRKLPSFSRVCRLIQIVTDFRRLACGSFDPKAEPDYFAECLSDLNRVYGDHSPRDY